ncbi:hypothetical protein [Campylobacter geochelonis]|uniref:hypothetical protein n=1 Tax=Campylobacter geochelonis TaxID=1780362 RepID=UPI0007707E57|nr:hypothetical protein [Campylobacter geochelonis]CZE48197.1 prophage MuSo1%2C F protein [Campylobacter geochelonis]
MVKVLDNTTEYYFDNKGEKDKLIFWDDKLDSKKINKTVITLDYNIKKFGVTNVENYKVNLKSKQLIKIKP